MRSSIPHPHHNLEGIRFDHSDHLSYASIRKRKYTVRQGIITAGSYSTISTGAVRRLAYTKRSALAMGGHRSSPDPDNLSKLELKIVVNEPMSQGL